VEAKDQNRDGKTNSILKIRWKRPYWSRTLRVRVENYAAAADDDDNFFSVDVRSYGNMP
jgi:hypothetical protein